MSAMADSAENSNSITPRQSSVPSVLLSEPSVEITHPFECYRCSKRFASTQALGGHQNAHKKERNEELRLYIEQRLASKRQSPKMNVPSPMPLLIVQPDGRGVQSFGHFVPPELAILPSYGPMVQLQSVAPGFIYGYDRLKVPVFMPVGFQYGPTRTGVKGGEVPYTASHQENQNCHPYKNPVNKKPMPLKLYPSNERDFWAKAEEDSKEYSYADQALINEDREDADKTTSKDEEMNLNLTLRL